MRDKTVCFTGHRDIRNEDEEYIRSRIREQLQLLLGKGFSSFVIGGARGFDMLAAEELLEMRQDGKNLYIISALPFPDWRAGWPGRDVAREERILNQSDEIFYSGETHCRRLYLDRDRKMVDISSVCIAWCTRDNGGTAYTIRYALKQGLQVINLADWDINKLDRGGNHG